MKVKAYAKINLLLDVVSKLDNGYHSIYSIMQSVDLFDIVTVEKNSEKKIIIKCETEGVPTDEKNIAHKAAVKFFDYCGIEDHGITVTIEKNIPHAAGMAGGSADGAAVIKALNEIYHTNLRYIDLIKIGVKVGADVPFCIFGGTCLCQNIGEVLSFLPDMPDCEILIVKPLQAVPTEGAYESYDNVAGGVRHPDNTGMLQAVLSEDLKKICSKCNNVFEQAIEVCDRATIKAVMRKNHSLAACMSGSGPTVFGIFDNGEDISNAYKEIKKSIDETYICKPVKYGCEIID